MSGSEGSGLSTNEKCGLRSLPRSRWEPTNSMSVRHMAAALRTRQLVRERHGVAGRSASSTSSATATASAVTPVSFEPVASTASVQELRKRTRLRANGCDGRRASS